MAKVAFRDSFRSSVLGLAIRSVVVVRYRRLQRLAQARRAARTDDSVFTCPVCNYTGLFVDRSAGRDNKPARRYASCPDCGSAERHRLQIRVLEKLLPDFAGRHRSVLHFAPETTVGRRLKAACGTYETADLFRRDVDVRADIVDLPVADGTYDLVYASHVLEHVPDDQRAVREIHRILKPGGLAILPVPIYSEQNRSRETTLEYGGPRADEDGHVRAPGLDYFDRYRQVFGEVTVYTSDDFPVGAVDNQLYIRPPAMTGTHYDTLPDYVPVCRKA